MEYYGDHKVDDLLRAEVIQSLMCYDILEFDEFDAKHDVDFRQYFVNELERLKPLADDGLVLVDENRVHITAKGRLLLRSIAMVFDRYINPEENHKQFSKAI